MPGLQRMAQLKTDALGDKAAMQREAEFEMRREPFALHRITGVTQLTDHIVEILFHEMRQHEAIMQLGSPA